MSLKFLLFLSLFAGAYAFNNIFRRFFEDRRGDNFLGESEDVVLITLSPPTTLPTEENEEIAKLQVIEELEVVSSTFSPVEEIDEDISSAEPAVSGTKSRGCTGHLLRLPEFIESLNCTAADEWRAIAETQNSPRRELRQMMTVWAVKYEVLEGLEKWFEDLETAHTKKSEKYAEVLSNVDTMLQKIDEYARDESLSLVDERQAVADLYEKEDRVVVEVVNLIVQLVRSWAGEKLPFRKMRPLQGVRQIWTEI
ncbi:unnamed protein product, partial [Mesorhabditis spiculigera]